MPRFLLAVVLLLVTYAGVPAFVQAQAVSTAQAVSDWRQTDEAWYVIEFDGRRSGWANELTFDNGSEYRTVSEQYLVIRRGSESAVEIRMTFAFVETHQGEPVRVETSNVMGQTPEKRLYDFRPDGLIEETITRGGNTTRRTIPAFEGVWFMPQAAGRFEKARREAGADSFEYRSIDVSNGLGISRFLIARTGEETFDYDGRTLPVSVWSVESTVEGTETTQERTARYSIEDHELVATSERIGAWTITSRRTSRSEALKAIEAAPEILISAFVPLESRIQGAHRSTSAVYSVRIADEETYEFPTAGAQRAETEDDGHSATLTIDLRKPTGATDEDLANESLRSANSLIECTDAEIVRFTQNTLGDAGSDPLEQARALHQAVYRHIRNKNFGTAFASARETLDSRAGDCSEHSVLLCAVLRAAGFPARVASGLIYVDSFEGKRHVFGWHMWTQALIDGKWVDLDATLSHPFSAAHILVGVSDLANGAMNEEFARLAMLMGRLEIRVVEVGYSQE